MASLCTQRDEQVCIQHEFAEGEQYAKYFSMNVRESEDLRGKGYFSMLLRLELIDSMLPEDSEEVLTSMAQRTAAPSTPPICMSSSPATTRWWVTYDKRPLMV